MRVLYKEIEEQLLLSHLGSYDKGQRSVVEDSLALVGALFHSKLMDVGVLHKLLFFYDIDSRVCDVVVMRFMDDGGQEHKGSLLLSNTAVLENLADKLLDRNDSITLRVGLEVEEMFLSVAMGDAWPMFQRWFVSGSVTGGSSAIRKI